MYCTTIYRALLSLEHLLSVYFHVLNNVTACQNVVLMEDNSASADRRTTLLAHTSYMNDSLFDLFQDKVFA